MITIEKLFENVSYTSNADISKIKIKGIATDSRQVKDGDLFVCIRGKTTTDTNTRWKRKCSARSQFWESTQPKAGFRQRLLQIQGRVTAKYAKISLKSRI